MDIVNTTQCTVATLPGQFKFPERSLTLIAKATFDLIPDGVAVPADEQQFPTGDETYEDPAGQEICCYPSDFEFFKPRADLLLVGNCHPPGGMLETQCEVSFSVGNQSKNLAIFGDRFWTGILSSRISVPEPIGSIPLSYVNSFGGNNFAANPIGKGNGGASAGDPEANSRPLPNIEDPQRLIRAPRDRPAPAGFGPLGKMWEQRLSLLGTYNDAWQTNRWPWFPSDFDWNHCNSAPPEMQKEGYLQGDEQLALKNLTAEHALLKCRLPGWRVRCFLNENLDVEAKSFREVSMNLDTLWIDAESQKLVLVWRGVCDVLTEGCDEVSHVYVVSEKVGKDSRDVIHHQQEFDSLLKQLQAEEDWEPTTSNPDKENEIAAKQARKAAFALEFAKIEKQEKENSLAAGIDLDNPPQPTPEAVEEEKRIMQEMDQLRKKRVAKIDRETVIQRAKAGESFPGEDLSQLDLSGCNFAGVDFHGAKLVASNLSQCDLAGANLCEADLRRTLLVGADLSAAVLNEADASEADLSDANLSGASLKETIFEKANLERCDFSDVEASNAYFSTAILNNAVLRNGDFSSADFTGCELKDSDFHNAVLCETCLEGVQADRINLSHAQMTGLRASGGSTFSGGSFRECQADDSVWENANLDETDFSCAIVRGADFDGASLKKANLNASDMAQTRMMNANLMGATLVEMNFFEGSFENACLSRADFRRSNLYGVEFINCILDETRFDGTNLKMTKLATFGGTS